MLTPILSEDQTLKVGAKALQKIVELQLPATPRHYNLMFAYASGAFPSITQAIDHAVSRKSTEIDVDHLYSRHIARSDTFADVGNVGERLANEVDQVMALVDAAIGLSSGYRKDLKDARCRMELADSDGLRLIVEGLVRSAKESERLNRMLQSRLQTSKGQIDELKDKLQTAIKEAMVDPLTGLANRKLFDQSLAAEMAALRRGDASLSLLMIDIDHFKQFNDKYGHLVGDHVLRLVGAMIKESVKGQDLAARFGGEEFAVVPPNTVLRSAVAVADQIRIAVLKRELVRRETREPLGRITLSIGVAACRREDTAQTLIARADTCLYAAKHCGRNRVVSESGQEAKAVA